MSEAATTIIKLLSALTSPKAAVKYISVAVFIVVSWKYLSGLVNSFGTPEENVSIVVLLAGVGIGSIVGQVVTWIGGVIWQFINTKLQVKRLVKQTQKEAAENARKKEKDDQTLALKYAKSFIHLDWDQKDKLRELTLRDVTLDLSSLNFKALLDNKYIKVVSQISSRNYLVTLNPAIFEITRDTWKQEISDHVDGYFFDMTPEKSKVLALMEERNIEDDSIIDFDVQSTVSPYYSCIRREAENESGFWLCFRAYYLSEFEQRTGKEYQDETWIDKKRMAQLATA